MRINPIGGMLYAPPLYGIAGVRSPSIIQQSQQLTLTQILMRDLIQLSGENIFYNNSGIAIVFNIDTINILI